MSDVPMTEETPEMSLPDRIGAHLTSLIMRRRLLPGSHLVTEALSAELGVSRIPVREALRILAGQGLVEFARNRGVFVARVSADQSAEILQVRARLEPWAAELAARRRTPGELTRLSEVLDAGSTAIAAGRRVEQEVAHHDYLRTLSIAAHHTTLDQALLPLHQRTVLAMAAMRHDLDAEQWERHRAVHRAIADRDAGLAAALTADQLAGLVESGH